MGSRKEKVLQFGEGAFLRAFVDWMIDELNEKCAFDASVTVIKPRAGDFAENVVASGGAFTACFRGIKNAERVEQTRRVTCTTRFLRSVEDYEEYIHCAHNPDLRFVVSNTTEAGIAYNAGDTLCDTPQKSFPAKVTAFLYERFKHFNGEANKSLVFLPCELNEKNGTMLKSIILRYAKEWQLGDTFISWASEKCIFCDTLVDRIVSGLQDGMVVAEPFHLWVIQAPSPEVRAALQKELPFEKAGLNVVWTDDLDFYRKRKVRILNGAHTALVPAAYQAGIDIVADCLNEPSVNDFLHRALFAEIIPALDDGDNAATSARNSHDTSSVDESSSFAHDVLERFANPFIKHQLSSIALNSVAKFNVRVLPSIIDYMKLTGAVPQVLSCSFAALISFYRGVRSNGSVYTCQDDAAVLERFKAIFAHNSNDCDEIVNAVFAESWWTSDSDIAHNGKLKEAVKRYLAIILQDGIMAAIQAAIAA
ncbi:MAG: tagaturonate reductase [Treponemataceae bacterium]|nr:MAG: tagaturonate reductase [Treponemataceae bacterium]